MNPPSPDEWVLDWIAKISGAAATLMVGAIGGAFAYVGFARKAGNNEGRIEERLRALESWTAAHDEAVGKILDRLDINVGKINERIDRLSELITHSALLKSRD